MKANKARRFVKKALAVSLSLAMAGAFLPAAKPQAVSAAAPYVRLRTSFKTLRVGQKNTMTLKNNTLKWKITKVATNDRTIAMVFGRTEKDFQIKGKAVGRTTVKARLKTTARKKYNSKLVKCRVNVIAAQTEQEPTESVVSTQAELDTALKSSKLAKLTIRTANAQKFEIPAGTYQGVDLIVDAPASDVTNHGVFHSIEIQAIRSDTWFENAVGNTLKVLAQTARIVVNKGAKLSGVEFAKADADVKLEVNGSVDQVSIKAKMNLSITGKPESPVGVTVDKSAEGSVLVSEVPVKITLYAAVDITLEKGAEGSSVDIKAKDVKPNIKNNTTVSVTVTNPDGSKSTVSAGGIPSRPNFGSGSSTPNRPTDTTTGGSITTTGGAIDTDKPGNSGDPGGSLPGDSYLPGGDGSGGIGPSGVNSAIPAKILAEEIKPVLQAVTITRSAFDMATDKPKSVSVSAIVTYTIPYSLNDRIQGIWAGGRVQRYVEGEGQEEGTWEDIPENGWKFTRIITPIEFMDGDTFVPGMSEDMYTPFLRENTYIGYYETFRVVVDNMIYGGSVTVAQIAAINKDALYSCYIMGLMPQGMQSVTLAGIPYKEDTIRYEGDYLFSYTREWFPIGVSINKSNLDECFVTSYTMHPGEPDLQPENNTEQ